MSKPSEPPRRLSFLHFADQIVRFGDLDRHNHVNNIAVCSYVEDARVRLRSELFPATAANPEISWMVVEFAINFHTSLDYGSDVVVGTICDRVGTTSYTLRHGVFTRETCVASARTITVCADQSSRRPRPLPDEASTALAALQLGDHLPDG